MTFSMKLQNAYFKNTPVFRWRNGTCRNGRGCEDEDFVKALQCSIPLEPQQTDPQTEGFFLFQQYDLAFKCLMKVVSVVLGHPKTTSSLQVYIFLNTRTHRRKRIEETSKL